MPSNKSKSNDHDVAVWANVKSGKPSVHVRSETSRGIGQADQRGMALVEVRQAYLRSWEFGSYGEVGWLLPKESCPIIGDNVMKCSCTTGST